MSYGWSSDDHSSGDTGGADYSSARRAYDAPSRPVSSRDTPSRSRISSSAKASSRTSSGDSRRSKVKRGLGETPHPIGLTISTDSTHPLVVALDGTGSMQEWPDIILEKNALLGKEVERYAPNYAISYCVFGDGREGDSYPLQVRDFAQGPPLDAELAALCPEGGGGDYPEDHGLVAYYYHEHCKIPKAVKPIFVVITDTDFHENVPRSIITKYTGDKDAQAAKGSKLFAQLRNKFSVYAVLRDGSRHSFWANLLGEDYVLDISNPRDIVEILIGIVSIETGKLEDFAHRSSLRHSDRPDRVSRLKTAFSKHAERSKIEDGGKARSGMESRKLI